MKNYKLCKDVENLLQPYLENKLNIEQLRLLNRHVKECPDCYDELEIRYLLVEGLNRLEDGETIDLQKDLDNRLYKSSQKVLLADRMQAIVFILEGVAAFLTLVNIIVFFFL